MSMFDSPTGRPHGRAAALHQGRPQQPAPQPSGRAAGIHQGRPAPVAAPQGRAAAVHSGRQVPSSDPYTKFGHLYPWVNETQAYQEMWRRSFRADQQTVYCENAAWLTNKGVLMLPNYKNRRDESDLNYYRLVTHEGVSYVRYHGQELRILGVVHTHPNGWNEALSPADEELAQTEKYPVFTIGPTFVYHGRVVAGNMRVTMAGTRDDLFTQAYSLYDYL